MNKKIFLIMSALLIISLIGCSNVEKDINKKVETNSQEEKINNDKDFIDTFKKEYIPAEFVKINAGDLEGKKVNLSGKVSSVDKFGVTINTGNPNFLLSQKEGDGFGAYMIDCLLTKEQFEELSIKEGIEVNVWGIVNGKDTVGIPIISTSIIEK